MRVLHVWNTAGVASVIVKYQARVLGWKTWVLMRKQYDPFGLTLYGEACRCSTIAFYAKALNLVRKYDIVHVHSLDKIVPIIRMLYPSKKIIMHYHGTDIRRRWNERRKYWKHADLVIVSTPDLLEDAPPDVVYLPNPVDTELFKPIPELRRPGTALYFYDPLNPSLSKDVEWAEKVASELGLKLTIHDRRKNPIPYKKLPWFLNMFEYFIDKHSIPSLSKTGLEALACGLKVIRWDKNIVYGLPEEHKPENVIYKLAQLYRKIIA